MPYAPKMGKTNNNNINNNNNNNNNNTTKASMMITKLKSPLELRLGHYICLASAIVSVIVQEPI